MTVRPAVMDAALKTRLAEVEGVIFDVDGCLVLSDKPGGDGGLALPGASEALTWLRESGRRVVLFTNASSKTPHFLAAGLTAIGLDVAPADVLTPSVVAAELLRARYPGQPVMAFGGSGLLDVLKSYDIELVHPTLEGSSKQPAAVIIGWDVGFDRDRLQIAADAIWGGADFLVTSDARRFATRTRPTVGLGGFIAKGLAYVTERDYEVVGKPSEAAMQVASARLGVQPSRMLVAGDDLTLEIRMGLQAGALSALVTTGIHGVNDVELAQPADRPDLIVDGLPELIEIWRDADDTSPARG
ncbi:MAG TPA: HAD-IIA family hydrolase [Acidothermaceae bacterium]